MGYDSYYESYQKALRGEYPSDTSNLSNLELSGYNAGRDAYNKNLSAPLNNELNNDSNNDTYFSSSGNSFNYSVNSAPIVVHPGENWENIKAMGKKYTAVFIIFAALTWVTLILGIVIGQLYSAKIGWKFLAVCGISICICAFMTFFPLVWNSIREPVLFIWELIKLLVKIIKNIITKITAKKKKYYNFLNSI
jgi:hypothetical protein